MLLIQREQVMPLTAGMSFEAALIYGNVTGGLAVEKLGTAPAMPYKEEIMAALNK